MARYLVMLKLPSGIVVDSESGSVSAANPPDGVAAVLPAGNDEDYPDDLDQSVPEYTDYLMDHLLGCDSNLGWVVVSGCAGMDEAAEAALGIAKGPCGN